MGVEAVETATPPLPGIKFLQFVNNQVTFTSIINGKDYCFSAALASMLRHVARY